MSVNTKAAWGRIRERLEQVFIAYEKTPAQNHWLFGPGFKPWPDDTFGSLNDEVQKEYRAGRITEDERNAMRAHIKTWLGDPDSGTGAHWPGSRVDNPARMGYEIYACGMWVPSAAPMGETESAIILSTLVILEEEDEPVEAVAP
jgi:hypothetical protein